MLASPCPESQRADFCVLLVLLFRLAHSRHFLRINDWYVGWSTPLSIFDFFLHLQIETLPWEGHCFSPVGDFACYTARQQEKQAPSFLYVHWSFLFSRYAHPQVIIICELILWLGYDVRLVGGPLMLLQEPKGSKSCHLFGNYIMNASASVRYLVVNKEKHGHSTCMPGVSRPEGEWP